jgi:threonine/homoserine/homoserine lactone efflux protein
MSAFLTIAAIHFLALISPGPDFVVVSRNTLPLTIQILYGTYFAAASFTWFTFVATILSLPWIQSPFQRVQIMLERVLGALFIAFGIKLAFATRE